jgi:two-component system, response regulator RegA
MRDAESTTKSLKVLLVDDNRFHREQLAHGLTALGHTVQCANTYDEMLDSVSSFEPDCSVIEPVLAGTPWVRCLRAASESLMPWPWLVVTAFLSKAMRLESLRLGARHVLAKPATAKQIVQSLASDEFALIHGSSSEDLSLARVEWEHLNEVLSMCEGNVTEAARRLGIPRQSLYNKLRKLPATPVTTDASASKYLTRRS